MSYVESDVWDALEKLCQRGKPFYPKDVADLVEIAIKRGRKLETELDRRRQTPNAWGYESLPETKR